MSGLVEDLRLSSHNYKDDPYLSAKTIGQSLHEHHHFLACKNYDRIITSIHLQRYYTATAASHSYTNDAEQKRIMVVEDDIDINYVVKLVLSDEGYKVDSYTNPFSAIRQFRTGLYHLIIIDIIMPKMNGFELCEKIRKLDNKVKVCFLTASEMYLEEYRKGSYPQLDTEIYFIRKPVQNEELIRIVRLIINSTDSKC